LTIVQYFGQNVRNTDEDANMPQRVAQSGNRKGASRRPALPTRSERGRKARPKSVRARSLDRAIEIIQLLHAVRKPLPVGEIARRLRAPRSTVYEIINIFLAADILEHTASGTGVFFGRAIYLYANDYFATHASIGAAQEEVRRLAALTGETAQYCMPIGNKYAVVSMQNSTRLFRIGSDVGVLVPIPWTASGRLFVAHMTLEELTAFVPAEDFRTQDGREIDPAQFLKEARVARDRGICVISGLVDDYATCLAAPVLDPGGKCIATICLIISSSVSSERSDELAHILKESARRLSRIGEVRDK
jgi:DNA-binding IclR family transcriptional regulator